MGKNWKASVSASSKKDFKSTCFLQTLLQESKLGRQQPDKLTKSKLTLFSESSWWWSLAYAGQSDTASQFPQPEASAVPAPPLREREEKPIRLFRGNKGFQKVGSSSSYANEVIIISSGWFQ